MSNVDLGAIKFLLDCFSTYFPDMLERIIILEMPWIMNAIWKIVKQWMTEDQRRRTVFCSFKDIKQYIDPENLLTYMGGKDTWEYKYPPEKDEVPFLDQVNDFCFVPEASAGVTPAAMFSELYDSQTELDDVTCDVTEDGITASDSDIQNPYQQVGSPHYGYNIDTSYNDYLTPRTLQKRELIRSKKATINKTDKFNYSSPANPADADERRKTKSNYYTNFVNGINLKSLLIMSPATDVIFRKEYVDERTGRYVSYITLTNLTRSEQVAFKIKTNSPDHYLVKPNSGYVSPGDTVTIFIYMNPGYEYSLSKDRFLVLYQKKGNATSVKEFWRTHVSKDSHFEHRVQVKFIKSSDVESEIANLDSSISGEPVPYSALNRSPSLQNNQMIPSNFASPSNKVQKEMSDAELQLLAKEVFDLKNTMLTMESNSDRLRSKLRFSLIMHCFVIFLLFYVVLKLFVLTSLLQLVTCFFVSFYNVFAQTTTIIDGLPTDRPLIVAHRGSSGMLPEHTVEAYQLAIEQGADVIECDLAVTKDLQFICSHDPFLNATTNIASIAKFADRVRSYIILGQNITDYFTIDFTLEELKSVRKVQSRSYRNQAYNGMFPLASFDDYVTVAKNVSNNRTIGIYPETKVPFFFNSFLKQFNTTMEDILLELLNTYSYTEKTSPCFVQSFSQESLRYMSNRTKLPLVYLTEFELDNKTLSAFAEFCYGLGTSKNAVVNVDGNTRYITKVTDFVQRAHAFGLKVHSYTFRNEDRFLAWDYGADFYREYQKFFEIGVDGYFTDFPWSLANYMQSKNVATSSVPSYYFVAVLLLFALLVSVKTE